MSSNVLFVDDDANILASYQRSLRKQFAITTAVSGEEALQTIRSGGPFAVIVADMQMPGMNGLELLIKVQQLVPDPVRIMLTGNADQKTAVEAVNQGHVFRFLNKPCEPDILAQAIASGIQHYLLVLAERELLEKTLSATLKLLTEILANLEPESFGRSQKVRDYAKAFGNTFQSNQTWALEAAAMLSRIGFITLPGSVIESIRSRRDLTGPEQQMLSELPRMGYNLLANIPRLGPVAEIVLYQNKNFDGSGFPVDNEAGDSIPIGARILRVLVDLVHLEEEGIPTAKALELLPKRKGCYDPAVLDAAFACFDVYLASPASAETTSQALRLADLRAGHVLLSNVETSEGMLIVTSGTEITAVLLQKLHNFGALSGIKEPIYVEG